MNASFLLTAVMLLFFSYNKETFLNSLDYNFKCIQTKFKYKNIFTLFLLSFIDSLS